jgi:hypothetical protein
MTKRSVFVSASSAPGALSSAASIVGTAENVTGSNSPTFVQNSVAEKRSHIATCAPISIGSIVVTSCALTWKSGSTIPITSPCASGSSSANIRMSAT